MQGGVFLSVVCCPGLAGDFYSCDCLVLLTPTAQVQNRYLTSQQEQTAIQQTNVPSPIVNLLNSRCSI